MQNNIIYPADDLLNETLRGGWKVVKKIDAKTDTGGKYSSCYIVENSENELGFLKAFDFRDLIKAEMNGHDHVDTSAVFERTLRKFNSERDLIKKCNEEGIDNIVKLIDHGMYNKNKGDLNTQVRYFILEYSKDGNLSEIIRNKELDNLVDKFKSLVEIFDAMHNLHKKNIMHLDLKPSNILYFIESRLSKITDFGSARQWLGPAPDEFKDDADRVVITRAYAPPEVLYKEPYSDWNSYRKKIDLYLLGNIVVMCFTNYTFTGLLKEQMISFDTWRNDENIGKMKQLLPNLTEASSTVYTMIEDRIIEINGKCDNPLNESDILLIMEMIRQLCNPDPELRGHPDALKMSVGDAGLDRFRDRFITLHQRLSSRLRTTYTQE